MCLSVKLAAILGDTDCIRYRASPLGILRAATLPGSIAMTDAKLFDVLYSQRAVRKYKRDPVPKHLIHKVIEAATKAPSAVNMQPWRFVVVTEPAKVRWVAELYSRTWRENNANPSAKTYLADKDQKVLQHAHEFGMGGIFEVPCFIFVCSTQPSAEISILQASQNLMLAARGLGLGTIFTTLLARYWGDVKKYLGIPENVHIVCMIPLGYPSSPAAFGPTRRLPVEEVAFQDAWGTKFL